MTSIFSPSKLFQHSSFKKKDKKKINEKNTQTTTNLSSTLIVAIFYSEIYSKNNNNFSLFRISFVYDREPFMCVDVFVGCILKRLLTWPQSFFNGLLLSSSLCSPNSTTLFTKFMEKSSVLLCNGSREKDNQLGIVYIDMMHNYTNYRCVQTTVPLLYKLCTYFKCTYGSYMTV